MVAANLREVSHTRAVPRVTFISAPAQLLFLLAATSVIRIVHWLGQSISQIQQVFRHANSAEQVCLNGDVGLVGKKLFDFLLYNRQVQDLVAAGPHVRCYLNEQLDRLRKFLRENVRDLGVNAAKHFLVQALHVLSAERWFQSH